MESWILENLEQWRSLVNNAHETVIVINTEQNIKLIVTNTENKTVIVIKKVNK